MKISPREPFLCPQELVTLRQTQILSEHGRFKQAKSGFGGAEAHQ